MEDRVWNLFAEKNSIYNRETIAAWNYEIQQMSFMHSFLSMQLQRATLFLIQGSQTIMIKGGGLSANGEILIKGIVSLLKNLFLEKQCIFKQLFSIFLYLECILQFIRENGKKERKRHEREIIFKKKY